ncbi:MAG: beta-propeller fold lactonase family protein [Candidatus Sulfotelmatobacter sp.]
MTSKMLFLLSAALAIGTVLPTLSKAETDAAGAVFVMTNAASHNEIIAYHRHEDGSLQEVNRFLTGGRGSGGIGDPLGSQGSLTLSRDHSLLFAVNAGSGEISVFQVLGSSLILVDKSPSGGAAPVAVAQLGSLVYVVNEGAASNVVGFRLGANGHLRQIVGSRTFLSTANSGPASLSFSPDGQFLLVTEKLTNSIDAFHVQIDGTLAPITVNPSAGAGAFAVLFAPNGTALVVGTGPAGETNASTLSSYSVVANGTLSSISTSVPTLGAAACWLAVTPNGRFVYAANSGSSTIAGFALSSTGVLTSLPGTLVGTLPTGSTNLDTAISSDGKFLFTLNSGTGTVGIFGINQDGTLTNLGDVGGLSADDGFNGIAAN